MSEATTSEITAAMEIGKNQTQVIEIDGQKVLVTPEGHHADYDLDKRLDKYREAPKLISAHVELHTAQAFIGYADLVVDRAS